MLDIELRRIVPKAAGTYFIVRDNSQVEEIEAENKMRLFFINVEQGPINMAISFAKGDKTGFQTTFGKGTRMMKKKGNFSIDTCLDALDAGPITVVNLRKFDDELDKCDVCGFNMNTQKLLKSVVETPYRSLFNTNSFWTPTYDAMNNIVENSLLNFANVGNSDFSIFVVRSKNVSTVTSEGNESLANCSMVIDEYPAIDFNQLVGDTIVDVYLFNNTFDPSTVTTNKYYGHLFNDNGYLDLQRIDELCSIPESGYKRMFTGSVIPNLTNENGEEISINTVINQYFMETGLICDINEDLFEMETANFIDPTCYSFYDETGKRKEDVADVMLSHVLPETLSKCESIVFPPTTNEQNVEPEAAQIYVYPVETVSSDKNSFITSFEQGIRYGDVIKGVDRNLNVDRIEILEENYDKTELFAGYTRVKVTCDGVVDIQDGKITKFSDFTYNYGYIKPTNLKAYKVRSEQFIDGTPTKQSEILDMMIDPGIIKGIKGTAGIRYVVDCFKSYVESGYKSQYGSLMESLDEGNRFVRAIINEPFITDLQKSTNPLFKQLLNGTFDISYLPDGGNKNYSTKLLTKFTLGADKCFFFGPGEKVNNVIVGLAGKISNLFYTKTNAFDVVANETGIIDGIQELEYPLDDEDRMYCEQFLWNPIINFGGNNLIFGNLTGQKKKTAQQQIHNSELLAYIKEQLYNLSKSEAFKKGNYDDYLRTETESKNFMNSLALAGAIDADPVVICNTTNNTLEIRKQKIKLVHIEYTPVDCLDKVVFDLTIN